MANISFYHLTQTPLSQALPQLLEKTMQAQKKALIRVGGEMRLESLDHWLWVYEKEGWLPHGRPPSEPKGNKIWLTTTLDNSIEAEFLFVVEEADIDNYQEYERVFYIFDSSNESEVLKARKLWKQLKTQSVDLVYWKQDSNKKWIKS